MKVSNPDFAECPADPERKRALNARLFAALAGRYDLINRFLSFGRDAAWKRKLTERLPERPAPLCLDVACGTGDLTALLIKRFPPARVIGADLTQEMLKAACRRGLGGTVLWSRQDMQRLAVGSERIDILTGGYALRNAPDLEKTLAEALRVLKPGGTAAFLELSKPEGRRAQALQYRLLRLWGGFWGLLFHGSPAGYLYLAESLRRYPDRGGLHAMMLESGFEITGIFRALFGFIEITLLRKRVEPGKVQMAH